MYTKTPHEARRERGPQEHKAYAKGKTDINKRRDP